MKRTGQNKGFTLVELLTVMAVIALLIGLLVPALSMVKDRAKDIQQRAQFHAINTGLEMFKADFGDYPESYDNAVQPKSAIVAANTTYCGANKLAEAMAGLDYLGFHPNADFRGDGVNAIADRVAPFGMVDRIIYHPNTSYSPNWETADENIQARKGPYVELENANAFRMDEVYTSALAPFVAGWDGRYPLTLCDVYARKRGGAGGKKTGTPILYYRAHTNFTLQDSVTDPTASIYNFYDNDALLALNMPDDNTTPHELYRVAGQEFVNFDTMIRNKNVQMINRPYRAGSFILISAGKDGSFGTGDDVFNFTKEAE